MFPNICRGCIVYWSLKPRDHRYLNLLPHPARLNPFSHTCPYHNTCNAPLMRANIMNTNTNCPVSTPSHHICRRNHLYTSSSGPRGSTPSRRNHSPPRHRHHRRNQHPLVLAPTRALLPPPSPLPPLAQHPWHAASPTTSTYRPCPHPVPHVPAVHPDPLGHLLPALPNCVLRLLLRCPPA